MVSARTSGIKFLIAYAAVIAAGCSDEGVGPSSSEQRVDRSIIEAAPTQDSLAPLYEMANPRRIPGRYIVRFKPDTHDVQQLATTIAASASGRVYHALQGLKGFWGELRIRQSQP